MPAEQGDVVLHTVPRLTGVLVVPHLDHAVLEGHVVLVP